MSANENHRPSIRECLTLKPGEKLDPQKLRALAASKGDSVCQRMARTLLEAMETSPIPSVRKMASGAK